MWLGRTLRCVRGREGEIYGACYRHATDIEVRISKGGSVRAVEWGRFEADYFVKA